MADTLSSDAWLGDVLTALATALEPWLGHQWLNEEPLNQARTASSALGDSCSLDLAPSCLSSLRQPPLGAICSPSLGIPDATHVCGMPVICAATMLSTSAASFTIDPPGRLSLLRRAAAAAEFLCSQQRESGRIDFWPTNFDSPPDTAFIVQQACALLDWLDLVRDDGALPPPAAPVLAALTESLSTFCQRAAMGIAEGGFHTPNHRWVVCSSLAQCLARFPGLPGADRLQATLTVLRAEGMDIDADGAWSERSSAGYDDVTNRSLLRLAVLANWTEAPAAIARNLDFNRSLLHADGTIESMLSTRWDAALHTVPLGMVGVLVEAADRCDRPDFRTLAYELWQAAVRHSLLTQREPLAKLFWLALALRRDRHNWGDSPSMPRGLSSAAGLSWVSAAGGTIATSKYSIGWEHNGLWRLRDGPLSISVCKDRARVGAVQIGSARVHQLALAAAYYGPSGLFVADRWQFSGPAEISPSRASAEATGDIGGQVAVESAHPVALDARGLNQAAWHPETWRMVVPEVTLISDGLRQPRRPAYEMPLGQPVTADEWEASVQRRALRPVPPLGLSLNIRRIHDATGRPGARLRILSQSGEAGVLMHLCLDFSAGGLWFTRDTLVQPVAGQSLLLLGGWGAMLYGDQGIRIGPGARGHLSMLVRGGLDLVPSLVRVLIPLRTPVDHTLELLPITAAELAAT